MSAHFDEEQARAHYRLLGHGDYGITELLVLSSDGTPPLVGFLDNEDAFVQLSSCWSGKRHVYVGAQPRRDDLFELAPNELRTIPRRACAADIVHVTIRFSDLDAQTEKRTMAARRNTSYGAAATTEELNDVLQASELLAGWDRFRSPVRFCSGNGAYVINSVDLEPPLAARPRLLALDIELKERFARIFSGLNTHIDEVDPILQTKIRVC